MKYGDVNLWGTYPSAADVDRPDHWDLTASGCWEKMRGAFAWGFIGGGTLGAAYAGINSLCAKHPPLEVLRIASRSGFHIGIVTGAVGYFFVWAGCWS